MILFGVFAAFWLAGALCMGLGSIIAIVADLVTRPRSRGFEPTKYVPAPPPPKPVKNSGIGRASDFGADGLTKGERYALSKKWDIQHPGEDSTKSRVGK